MRSSRCLWRRNALSTEDWAKSWAVREEDRLEEEFQELIERVGALRGERKRIMLKAIIGYVKGMLGS